MMFLIQFIGTLFDLMSLAIVARILMSWFRTSQSGAAYRFLYDVTEPLLGRARRLIPPVGMIDFSPLIVLILLDLAQNFIIRLLLQL